MSDEKPTWLERSRTIAHYYEKLLAERDPSLTPVRAPDGRGLEHALFMIHAMTGRITDQPHAVIDSETKACRWLGYLQCILVYEDIIDLDEAKATNRDSG